MPKISHFTRSAIFYFIIVLLVIMIIPFTVLLMVTSVETKEFERDRAAEFLSSNLKIISSTTDSRLYSLETGMTELLFNESFKSAVTKLSPYKTPIEYSDFNAMRTIRKSIRNAAIRSNEIENAYLYCVDAERLFISNINWDPTYNKISLQDTPWYQAFEHNMENQPWNITTSLESDKTILSCYRIIRKYQLPASGIFSINVTPDVILNAITDAGRSTGNTAVVIDSCDNLLYDNLADVDLISAVVERLPKTTNSGTFEVEYKGVSVFAAYLHSDYSGFTYVIFSPLSQIQGATARITRITVLYIVESVLVLLICILLVYCFFFRPIRLLANGMKSFEKGDFLVRMKENRSDEIGLINKRFNKMVEHINTLINENYVNELAKRDIQLKFMQNQINEHFLYNTLDSIHWLSKKHNTPDIGNMIKALANFYRTSLSNGRDFITIGEARDMIGSYLYLQGIRFGDSLSYTINFDDNLKELSVPKHLFLPLIENAISHGIHGKEDGEISVSLTKSKGGMSFSVTDNGRGIEKERLKQIWLHLKSNEVNIDDSFALCNINTQLKLYFGNDDGIQIQTLEGMGTTVCFDIPLKEDNFNGKDDNS